MNDNRPDYIKLYEAAQSALERGDKQAHDELSYAAYKAKIWEANLPAIEVWGGRSQEPER